MILSTSVCFLSALYVPSGESEQMDHVQGYVTTGVRHTEVLLSKALNVHHAVCIDGEMEMEIKICDLF